MCEIKGERVLLSTSAFIQEMIPLYLMGVIGFLGRKSNILNTHANGVMTQLMLYITLPALIIFSLHTDFSVKLIIEFFWLITMSIFVLFVSVWLAFLLRKRAKLPSKQKNVYESLIIFGNQGFIWFAVSYIVLGDQGIIYLTFFNIIYLILIWTYGIYLFTKKEKMIDWKVLFLNPGIIATMVGLVILFSPIHLPFIMIDTLETVGKVTIPLSMLLIGSMIADISLQEMKQFSNNIYIWLAALYKLLIIPLCLCLFFFLDAPFSLLVIAVLTAGMPSATTTSVYAQKFGADTAFSSFGVMISTLLCVVTIPMLYIFLQWLNASVF